MGVRKFGKFIHGVIAHPWGYEMGAENETRKISDMGHKTLIIIDL